MKYALITGPRGQSLFEEFPLSYHLVLAQYGYSEDYIQFYGGARNRGDFIMIDSGVAEDDPAPIEHIASLAEYLQADEVVLPDVLDDWEATVDASLEALKWIPEKHRAVVPQGKDWHEWERCLHRLVDMKVATICVAKRYERLPGGRAHALSIILKHGWHLSHHVHLLGFNEHPLREIHNALRAYPHIRGCDSAAPIAWAQHDWTLPMPHSVVAERCSYDWNERFDVEDAKTNIRLILDQCRWQGGTIAHRD